MAIGEILRVRRKALGWTQAQLAEKVGIAVKTVSNWENGRTLPDIVSLIRLSHLYGLSLDKLLQEGSDLVEDLQTKERLVRDATWGMLGPQLTNLVLGIMLFGPFFFSSWTLSDPMLVLLALAIAGNAASTQYMLQHNPLAKQKRELPRAWRWYNTIYLGLFIALGIAVLIRRTLIGW